ncbi:MAG: hypothetical protein JSV77_04165 [Dehalococcoidales bacterium]|nr:MAG: hypothetical protein JSV77_04165 [Dehalococcoidales bacterium]
MSNNDLTKLKTLLGYWVEHNQEHSQEFREWAARVTGLGDIGEDLRQASEEMDKASQFLSRAQEKLEEREA